MIFMYQRSGFATTLRCGRETALSRGEITAGNLKATAIRTHFPIGLFSLQHVNEQMMHVDYEQALIDLHREEHEFGPPIALPHSRTASLEGTNNHQFPLSA
jgi:hypothetical protein